MKGKDAGKIFFRDLSKSMARERRRIELLTDLICHLNTAPKPHWLDSPYLAQPDTTGYYVSNHMNNMPKHKPHYVWPQCLVTSPKKLKSCLNYKKVSCIQNALKFYK